MLELEAMDADQIEVPLAVQYVDHNVLETDSRNTEEHLFLRSGCQRHGIWYSRPGTGISHPTHVQCFSKPGDFLSGCDSHTTASGAMGMLAIAAGGVDIATALLGEPLFPPMPQIWQRAAKRCQLWGWAWRCGCEVKLR